MNFFIFVISVLLTIHSIRKVNGQSENGLEDDDDNLQEDDVWLTLLKRAELLSMTTRELKYTEDDYLLKPIMSILDKNMQKDLIRILSSLQKNDRDMIPVKLSGIAWKTTNGCERLSKEMNTPRRITLKIMYPVVNILYRDNVLNKLSTSDQQVLKSAEEKVENSKQLLCQ
jgi:hypothetical protein